MDLLYETNQFQTQLTQELKDSLPSKLWAEMLEYIETVPFIKHLVSDVSVRGTIKDRPWMLDEHGNPTQKKEIDITKPHMLENMNYFRERAIFFEEHGVYTHIPVNPNPKSDYAKFWEEEIRRWKYGLIREDGEWIPGPLYYYWNYSILALAERTTKGGKRSNRIAGFPRVYLGDYLFFHYLEQAREAGQHCKMLKARGIGASYKFSALSPCNMYTYPGSINPNFHLASDNVFLTGDKGIWGKVLDNLDWIGDHTPLPRMRTIDKKSAPMQIQLGYEDEYGGRRGLLSSVFAVSLKDNPDKARGIRGPLIHYEEDGLFPNLEKAWNVNREATEEDGTAFGVMFAAGTGGVEGASFEGSEKLFYHPDSYNIYGLPNVFDKNVGGESKCGFFWGAYLNRGESVTRENGEPDVIASLIRILSERKKIADSSSDPLALTQKKAESPITPQEAVMRTTGTVFPVSDLKEYLQEIVVNKDAFLNKNFVGNLFYNKLGHVEWKPTADSYPIRDYPAGNVDKKGAIEIFEMPKTVDGSIPRFRYIAGIDPYDDDYGTSLGSIFIFDTFTDKIVAEYTGRPTFANEFYEICLRLLKFYNAIGNYENNNKGLYTYFMHQNAIHYLCDNPEHLKDMDTSTRKFSYGNKSKGTRANPYVNKYARRLQADWMNSPSIDSDEEHHIPNLRTIRSLPYLKEAIAWNDDGNFDRVSAMGMCLILREEYKKYSESAKQNKPVNPLAVDPYFARNWNKGFNISYTREADYDQSQF